MKVLKWLNPEVDSLKPYKPGRPIEEVAREYGLNAEEVAKLASNENPLGPSRKALRALKDAVKEAYLYPDGGAYYLRQKLAAKYAVDHEQVIVGSGSNEILEFIGHCFMGPGRSIVVSQYAFVIYKLLANMFDTRIIEVPSKGLGHDLTAIRRSITDDTAVVFICNPNNPTGTLLRQAEVKRFMEKVPEHVLVVFDEAYAEICLSRMPDTLNYVRNNRNCVVLRTFSKAYGLAGLRVGYGIGPKAIVQALQKPRQPFNTNRLAQLAATAAIDDDAFVRRSRKLFKEGKDYLENACREMNLDFEPTFANFLLIKVGDGARVTEELTERGVIVRPMAGYGLPQYIRVSFGTMAQNELFVENLKEVLNQQ